MRKIDESRAANYIRKHSNYKKWLAFVLCLSLLTGTVTLYMLNKPATAMTEEGAESLGVVLETASDAEEAELIEETMENKNAADEGFNEEQYVDEESSEDEVISENAEQKETTDTVEEADKTLLEETEKELEEDAKEQLSDEKKVLAPEEKLANLEVPDSVDVSEYVTETIIERRLEDGSWEVIDRESLSEGDYIKVTFKYSIPDTAKLSDDIYLEIPREFEKLDTEEASFSGNDGTAELTSNHQIKIEYDDDVKKSILEDADVDVDTDDEEDDLQASLSGKIAGFFKLFSLTVYAAETESVSVRGTYGTSSAKQVESMDLDSSWITGVKVKLNPKEDWSNGFCGYDISNSQDINSGDTIPEGSLVYFEADYIIPAQTLCDRDGNLITDTITYNISDNIKINPQGDQYNPMVCDLYTKKDNESIKIGVLTVANGVATIKFDESFAKTNSEEKIKSKFFFAGKVSKTSDNEEDGVVFTFNDKVEVRVRVADQKKYGLEVTKENYVREGEYANTVEYTITVSSNGEDGSGGEITLTDTFSFSNEDARNSFAGKSNTQLKTITVTKNGSSVSFKKEYTDYGYKLVLPELSKGESYVVKYVYQYDSKLKNLEQDTTVWNSVIAHTDGFGDKSDDAEFTIEGEKNRETPDIKKEFVSIDKTKKTVTWKITVNSKKVDIGGFSLKDLLTTWNAYSSEMITAFKGTATIDPKINGNSTITFDGENGYKFPSNAGKRTYTITIVTPYDDYTLVNGKTLYNKATIDDGDHYNETPGVPSDDIDTDIEKGDRVEKKAEEYTYSERNAIIKWNIKAIKDIKCKRTDDNGKRYWLYVDEIKGNQVITDDQLNNLTSSLKQMGVSDITVETGDKVYLAERDVQGYTKFSIYFYQEVKEGFSFSYETTGSVKNGQGNETFSNDSYVYNKTIGDSEDKVEYKPMLSKYDGNMKTLGTYNYDDEYLEGNGILTWIIKLDIPADDRADYGTLTIKEYLPSSVTALNEEEGGLRVGTSPDKDSAVAFSSGIASVGGVDFSHNGQEITFNGNSAKGQTYYFTVKAKINEDQMTGNVWADGSVKKSFENKAVLIDKDGGELQWVSETTDINTNGDVIRKAQVVLNDKNNKQQAVNYEIEINKSAEDLLEGGDVLTLKDTLRAAYKEDCFNASLRESSIKVYEINNETGAEENLSKDEYSIAISESEITSDSWGQSYVKYCNIEFKLPDRKHIKIVYTYDFERLEKVGSTTDVYNLGSIYVNNIAVLEGVSGTVNSDEQNAEIKVYRIGAYAYTIGAHFNKVDSLDATRLLEGGKYTLWKYVKGSSSVKDDYGDVDFQAVYLDSLGTDKYSVVSSGDNSFTTTKGSCSFDEIETDVAYRIVETTAPEGYSIGQPLYFVFESAVGSTKSLPDDFTSKGGKIYAQGSTIILSNVKNGTTSLTVKKDWVNADGTKTDIQFKLSRRKSHIAATYNYYSVDVYYKTNGNIVTYKGYPSVRKGSTLVYNLPRYRYHVTTVTVNGKETVYPGLNWNETPTVLEGLTESITGNTVVIVNVQDPDSSLPDYQFDTGIKSSDDTQSENNESKETYEVGTYSLTDANGWKMTFDKLDKSYVDEETGEMYEWLYFVEEISHNGFYNVTYTSNNVKGVNQGVITIINTRNDRKGYALPRTGGVGTLPYALVGLGITGSAVIGGEVLRRRKKKGEDPA